MLDKLKPFNEKNSISNVVASVFSPETIIKPTDLMSRLNDRDYFKKYPRRGLLNSRKIRLKNFEAQTPVDKEVGFVMESFNERTGEIVETFKAENLNERRSSLSYSTKSYETWEEFINEYFLDLKNFSEVADIYVEGLSLTYRDQFDWLGDSEIDTSVIFKKESESEYLNKKFLNSKNGTFVMFSRTKENEDSYEDKIEISFSNDAKRIVIEHQYAIRFAELRKLTGFMTEEDSLLRKKFDIAHDENKSVLKDVLTTQCQEKIGLV